MEDITTRTKIGKNWYKPPMDNKTSGIPIPKPNKTHDKAPLKCHKCGSTSHLANTCPKNTQINEIEIEKDDTKETKDVSVHESDSEPSEEEELPDELSIENNNVSFEVTEVHTHLHCTVMNVWISYMCNILKCRKPNQPEVKVIQLDHLVSLIL
ncbi:hypothetical protein O181_125219 [Austropuccinia psidii MF-1]|uniref:CCHC-type domain-containing protein n=1 Tax=Austropuccinia psidii MF-1 TaxID=1389203 RepID=A0A9Q3KTN8_9BASI|nr:hypothetical protein [Austropuccinia psidii MF-1]